MYDFLIDHALANVWCTPDQDRQFIIEPAKISPFYGILNTVVVGNRSINLPLNGVRFHVYQIGQVYPVTLGLPTTPNVWKTLAYACNTNKMVIDVYANSGIQLPRIQIWYMQTIDKNIILAVQNQPTINIDLNIEPIYFRVYSNAFFDDINTTSINNFIEVNGNTMLATTDITALQTKYNKAVSLPGATYAFVNGIKVAGIDLFSVKIGDVAEYIYDSSIYNVVDIPISTLKTFISKLDTKNKYLVHYSNNNDNTIDYLDDVDFFIIEPTANNRHIGVYYHKNMVDAVRMITHKDYSVVVPYVLGYLNSISSWTDINKLTLRLHIRKSGYNRNLILENNRIEELYKLSDINVVGAMLGVNSTVSNWQAANLENSAYTLLMSSKYNVITRLMVEDAYGYNLISKLLGDTPQLVDVNNVVNNIPYGLISNSVAYEYDVNGILLEWHQHTLGTKYKANNINCYQVEFISGVVDTSLNLDEVYDTQVSTISPMYDHRFYICPIINNAPTEKYVDVTNTNNYTINNNVVTWNVDKSKYFTIIRSNKNILVYDLMLIANNGLINFTLVHNQKLGNSNGIQAMRIPMGELDIFLNGNSLIRDIDYIFNFPEIVIINKTFLVNVLTAPQRITIRYSGFCNSDFTSGVNEDIGFIKYDLLSYNKHFNIRDDKVLRIVVNGKYHNSDLLFAETNTGTNIPNINNGYPYSIRDIVVPFNGLGTSDTYTARNKSILIDNAVSSYMDTFLPQLINSGPNVIQNPYTVVSPFCCKIIYDLKSNIINDSRLLNGYNDEVVHELCAGYEYLLQFDPIDPSNKLDPNYVIIHPHNLNTVIQLTIYQYKFIDNVIRLYANNLVSLIGMVSIII